MKKRGNLITENVIFIILNLVFLAIMVVFLVTKASDAAPMEEKYAKEIALMIDVAKTGMITNFDMSDAVNKAKKEEFDLTKIVTFTDNTVLVRLRQDGKGYSYSFFNDVNPSFSFNNNGQAQLVVNSK